jgi:flagellar basal-body rod protein FlgC
MKENTMDLATSMAVAASGMRAQTDRMRVITENIANANSTATTPGGEPYRRKIATMQSEFDRQVGATMVQPGQPVADTSDFRKQYDPGNPLADKTGYVLQPNVNPLVEIMDMREAQRSYEADLTVMESSKAMLARTIDLLKK